MLMLLAWLAGALLVARRASPGRRRSLAVAGFFALALSQALVLLSILILASRIGHEVNAALVALMKTNGMISEGARIIGAALLVGSFAVRTDQRR